VTTGRDNAFIGINIATTSTNGSYTTCVGTDSMTALTSGVGNVCVGLKSQTSSTTGSTNVSVGNSSLFSLTTGIDNIAIGEKAGYNPNNVSQCHVTGNQCVFIGTSARPSTQNLTNATAIGNTAVVDADNTIQLGNTAVTSVKTSGTITAATPTTGSHLTTKTYVDDKFTILSDQNLKTTDTVTFGGLILPTIGGTAATLNFYEEFVLTTILSSAVFTGSINFLFIRIGKLVTMTFPYNLTFTTTSTGTLSNSVLIPSRFRPSFDQYLHLEIVDNGVKVDGLIQMVNSGSMVLSAAHSVSFTNGRTYTINPFSMSWVLQ